MRLGPQASLHGFLTELANDAFNYRVAETLIRAFLEFEELWVSQFGESSFVLTVSESYHEHNGFVEPAYLVIATDARDGEIAAGWRLICGFDKLIVGAIIYTGDQISALQRSIH